MATRRLRLLERSVKLAERMKDEVALLVHDEVANQRSNLGFLVTSAGPLIGEPTDDLEGPRRFWEFTNLSSSI